MMMKHEIPPQLLPAIGEQTELEIEGYQTPYQSDPVLTSPDEADRPFSNSRYPQQRQRAHLTPVTPVKLEKTNGDDDECSPDDGHTYPDGAILITEVDEGRERDGIDLYSDDVSIESEHIAEDDEDSYSIYDYGCGRISIGTNDVIENEEQWDTDLENDDYHEDDDLTGRIEYREICDRLGVVPATYFLRHIQDNSITMRYHGIGAMGAKAIALVLRNVVTLEHLNLQGNGMGGDGAHALSRMLQENESIADVNLSENNLGCSGLEHVCRMLSNNVGVKKMDMSDNGFTDSDVPWIVDTLNQNKCLKTLKLAKNRFGESGGEQLGPAIGGNDVMEELDLSWNHLRLGGALAIARGLQENVRLKVCLLAWNGLGPEGGMAIAEALTVNGSILELDISGNRLDMDTALRVAKALSVNEALTILRMGNNILTTAGAIALITAIHNNDSSAMEELDITDVPVEDEFLRIVDDVRKRNPDFRVRHGVVLRTGNAPEDQKKRHLKLSKQLPPIAIIEDEHIVVNDPRLLDIMRRHDPDGTFNVTPEQFISALDELAVPYDRKHIEDALHKLTQDESGRIYIGDFLNKNHRPLSSKERSFTEHSRGDVDERKDDSGDIQETGERSGSDQDEDEEEEGEVEETEDEIEDENDETVTD